MTIKYNLELSPEQARLVSEACDFYSRVLIGQFDRITEACLDIGGSVQDYCQKRDMANDLLRITRRIFWPELVHPGQSYGIGHNQKADRLYDVHQVLRNKIAWEEQPTGSLGVAHDSPMQFSDLPLPACSISKE